MPATPHEDAIARELEDVWLWPVSGRSPYSGANVALFPWTLAKAFLSSPVALAESIAERLRRLPEDAVEERRALCRLAELTEKSTGSAKCDALVTHLRDIGVAAGSQRRAVVFAERVATLNWLTERLRKDLNLSKDQVAVLHGGLSDVEQQAVFESFKLASSPIRVLVTGDTALLLTPSTDRFSGDIRVLTRLVEREHEAHTALGDAASLMGTYDVKAEEDAVRRVLDGSVELDAVVRTVEQVGASGGLDAFLASLAKSEVKQPAPTSDAAPALYGTDFDFLADAVAEFITTPQLDPPNGIKWQIHKQHSIASLTPPKDLKQRLQVLPQSYLRDRKVIETFKLATTPGRGRDELTAARSGDSTTGPWRN